MPLSECRMQMDLKKVGCENVKWLRQGYSGGHLCMLCSVFWGNVICGLCSDVFSSSDYVMLNGRMINEWWIWKDIEGSDHGLFQYTLLVLAWGNWRKPWKSAVRIVSVQAEIWTDHCLNTSRKHYRLSRHPEWGSIAIIFTKSAIFWDVRLCSLIEDCCHSSEKSKLLPDYVALQPRNNLCNHCSVFYLLLQCRCRKQEGITDIPPFCT
jgi:hypothetical protein